MEFYMKDVIKITGVKRERLREWIKRGYIIPSIKKSTTPRMRDIFSREDLFLVMLLKSIIESGWYREQAMRLLNEISRDDLRELIIRNDIQKFPFLRSHVFFGYSDIWENDYQSVFRKSFDEYFKYNPNPLKIARLLRMTEKDLALKLESINWSLGLKLVFFRHYGGKIIGNETGIICSPLVERIKNNHTFQKWPKEFMDDPQGAMAATDIYHINFGHIMDQVNEKLYLHYADRFGREFQKELFQFFGKKNVIRLHEQGKIRLNYDDDIQI